MRASSLRSPKTHIAAGLLTGIVLGYVCIRPQRSRTSVARCALDGEANGGMSPSHVNEFFNATRLAWGLSCRVIS